MDVRQLEYFAQVANLRGFNRAAAHLHVAQSALSRQVRQLEDELGVELFLRNSRGAQLTPAGELMLERAESLLRQFRQAREEVAAQADLPRGEIALGMPPSLGTMVTAPLLREYRRRYPTVFLNVWVGTSMVVREWVLAGKVDLGVFGTLESEPVLDGEPLCREDMFLVGPVASRLEETATVEIGRLAALPLILTNRSNSLRLLVENAASRRGLSLNVAMEMNSVALMIDLIQAGAGYSVLPYSAVRQLIAEKRVAGAKLRNLSYGWIVASSRERPLSAAGRHMRQMLQRMTAELIGGGDWPNAKLPPRRAPASGAQPPVYRGGRFSRKERTPSR